MTTRRRNRSNKRYSEVVTNLLNCGFDYFKHVVTPAAASGRSVRASDSPSPARRYFAEDRRDVYVMLHLVSPGGTPDSDNAFDGGYDDDETIDSDDIVCLGERPAAQHGVRDDDDWDDFGLGQLYETPSLKPKKDTPRPRPRAHPGSDPISRVSHNVRRQRLDAAAKAGGVKVEGVKVEGVKVEPPLEPGASGAPRRVLLAEFPDEDREDVLQALRDTGGNVENSRALILEWQRQERVRQERVREERVTQVERSRPAPSAPRGNGGGLGTLRSLNWCPSKQMLGRVVKICADGGVIVSRDYAEEQLILSNWIERDAIDSILAQHHAASGDDFAQAVDAFDASRASGACATKAKAEMLSCLMHSQGQAPFLSIETRKVMDRRLKQVKQYHIDNAEKPYQKTLVQPDDARFAGSALAPAAASAKAPKKPAAAKPAAAKPAAAKAAPSEEARGRSRVAHVAPTRVSARRRKADDAPRGSTPEKKRARRAPPPPPPPDDEELVDELPRKRRGRAK
ncbi:hypothetical protein JL722_8649 [Aureococcus anophagefferens]|nr:hypothetical protein JL722_8649 [Aureococcus anophagefferens]